jgi:hypothetical protein
VSSPSPAISLAVLLKYVIKLDLPRSFNLKSSFLCCPIEEFTENSPSFEKSKVIHIPKSALGKKSGSSRTVHTVISVILVVVEAKLRLVKTKENTKVHKRIDSPILKIAMSFHPFKLQFHDFYTYPLVTDVNQS